MPAGPRATVVVPVKNGESRLEALMSRLAAQELEGGVEVLAIDSGSRDASLGILARAGVRTLRIAPDEFNHGGTRNLGARQARGRYVAFLSQDAVPADSHVLRRLVGALEGDARLAGAFARQEPQPETDVLTRRDLSAWVAAGAQPRVAFMSDPARFQALAPAERYELAAFDNVASAVRKELLLAEPFAETRFGEDLEWGLRMLELGYGLAYVPEAVVLHSHARSSRALLRRNYLGHRLLYRLFGLRTIPHAALLLRAWLGTASADVVCLLRARAPAGAVLAAPAQALAAVCGQYLGARHESRGRAYPGWAR